MRRDEFLAKLEELFTTRGAGQYGSEAVTQLEHAIQAAWAAEQSGAGPELIAAALLHDIGHLLHGHGEDCAADGIDDRHEELGHQFLAKHFGEAVTEPVRLHVPAKRYLCYTDPTYLGALSPASVLSLKLQGGPMSPTEAEVFRRNPHHESAVRLRRWDEAAKVPGLATPGFAHFRPHLEASLGKRA